MEAAISSPEQITRHDDEMAAQGRRSVRRRDARSLRLGPLEAREREVGDEGLDGLGDDSVGLRGNALELVEVHAHAVRLGEPEELAVGDALNELVERRREFLDDAHIGDVFEHGLAVKVCNRLEMVEVGALRDSLRSGSEAVARFGQRAPLLGCEEFEHVRHGLIGLKQQQDGLLHSGAQLLRIYAGVFHQTLPPAFANAQTLLSDAKTARGLQAIF